MLDVLIARGTFSCTCSSVKLEPVPAHHLVYVDEAIMSCL